MSKKTKWSIDYTFPLGYYIYKSCGSNDFYLHKDLSVHKYCGEENFFKTRQEAKDVLDKFLK